MARNQADFRALRLTELPYVPLRNFMMKRLALRNAELAPLADLGEQNAYRHACLQFLLPTRAFSHLVNNDHGKASSPAMEIPGSHNNEVLSAEHADDSVTGKYTHAVEPAAEGIV